MIPVLGPCTQWHTALLVFLELVFHDLDETSFGLLLVVYPLSYTSTASIDGVNDSLTLSFVALLHLKGAPLKARSCESPESSPEASIPCPIPILERHITASPPRERP